MRSPTLRALVALVLGTACSSDAAPVEPPPTGNIQLASSVLGASVAQGYATTVDLTLSRTGGYAGAVTLGAEGLPANVTASFAPATLTGTTLNSTVTLQVGANATLGAAEVTLRASGAGVTARTVRFELTVLTPPLAVYPPTGAVTVSRGASAMTVIRVARANFTAPFVLSAEDLPSGISAAFSPATVNDSSAVLTITATAGAALGASALTVRANGGGAANATASIPFTVGGPGSGASVVWRFCAASNQPGWFAYRDGSAGGFQRVLAELDGTFSFKLTGATGAVAWVRDDVGYPLGEIHIGTTAELTARSASDCYVPKPTKSLMIPVAGLAAGRSARVRFGPENAGGDVAFPSTSLDVSSVPQAITDLLASRFAPSGGEPAFIPDRFIIRRGVDYAAGSTIPTVDFASAESFPAVAATITMQNLDGGAANPYIYLITPRGFLGGELDLLRSPYTAADVTYVKYGLPADRLQPGEFHVLQAYRGALDDDNRAITRYDVAHADRTLAFGPPMLPPTVSTIATAPYALLRVAGTWQAEYQGELQLGFVQNGAVLRDWTVTVSRAYEPGSASYQFDFPDLSGVTGFDVTWGLVVGVQTAVGAIARSPAITVPYDGAIFRAASRGAQLITP